jgi:hypothetical protein
MAGRKNSTMILLEGAIAVGKSSTMIQLENLAPSWEIKPEPIKRWVEELQSSFVSHHIFVS